MKRAPLMIGAAALIVVSGLASAADQPGIDPQISPCGDDRPPVAEQHGRCKS